MTIEITDQDIHDDEIEIDQYLVFEVKGQEFGIQTIRVQEIISSLETSEVPNAPVYIEGIASLRGLLATVINFRLKFGFEIKERDEDTRIIIVEQEGFPVGITVDSVVEVLKIEDEIVQEIPESMTITMTREVMKGVAVMQKRLIILLELDKVLCGTDYSQFTKETSTTVETQELAAVGAVSEESLG